MRNLYLTLLGLVFSVNLYAQTRVKLDENSIVKDSTGKIYNFKEWKPLTNTGLYKINATEKANEFLLELIKELKYEKVEISSKIASGEKYHFWKIETVDGTKYKPTDFIGKIVVINFWFVNCTPCRTEIPELNKLKAEFVNNKDIIFLAFALDNKEAINRFLKFQNFNYQIISDARNIIEYNEVKSFPTNLVIDKEGTIAASYSGFTQHNLRSVKQMISHLSDELK